MKFSFVFGFILLILFIISIFVGLPYVVEIIRTGSLSLPFSLPFSFPIITTQFKSNYFLKPTPQIGSSTTLPVVKPGESLYKDKISIGSIYFSGGAQINLRTSYFSKDAINITGFKIKSLKKGETIIGKATNLPQLDFTPSDIWLSGSESVDIIIGSNPLGTNFRVNNCFGWLKDIYNFGYFLDYCPGQFKLEELRDLDSSCMDLILRTGSCRMPNEDTLNKQSGKCRDWALKNMNYGTCVASHKNDSNFYKGWKIYTGNNNPIFDPRHDRIELLDQNGFLVDSYEY